jgi:hypothetical protein
VWRVRAARWIVGVNNATFSPKMSPKNSQFQQELRELM